MSSLRISGVLSLPSSAQSLGHPTHLSSVPELQAGPEQSKLVSGQARWREAPMSAGPVVGSQGHCEVGRELREEPGRCLVAPGPASSLPPEVCRAEFTVTQSVCQSPALPPRRLLWGRGSDLKSHPAYLTLQDQFPIMGREGRVVAHFPESQRNLR